MYLLFCKSPNKKSRNQRDVQLFLLVPNLELENTIGTQPADWE